MGHSIKGLAEADRLGLGDVQGVAGESFVDGVAAVEGCGGGSP